MVGLDDPTPVGLIWSPPRALLSGSRAIWRHGGRFRHHPAGDLPHRRPTTRRPIPSSTPPPRPPRHPTRIRATTASSHPVDLAPMTDLQVTKIDSPDPVVAGDPAELDRHRDQQRPIRCHRRRPRRHSAPRCHSGLHLGSVLTGASPAPSATLPPAPASPSPST